MSDHPLLKLAVSTGMLPAANSVSDPHESDAVPTECIPSATGSPCLSRLASCTRKDRGKRQAGHRNCRDLEAMEPSSGEAIRRDPVDVHSPGCGAASGEEAAASR